MMDPLGYLLSKLNHLILSFLFVGIIFAAMGVAIIFIPQIIQYFFVIGFVVIGLLLVTVAARISHIAAIVKKFQWPSDVLKRK